ncbi:RICIN domain-containing protein [Micromonospora ureilytica]|nr:RICIN domain-containing protein [Micromonospora ureilytica]
MLAVAALALTYVMAMPVAPTPVGLTMEIAAASVKLGNRTTGKFIDGMGRTTNGAAVGQYSSSSSDNQQWTIDAVGDYVQIKNRATGLYLDGMGRTTGGSICGQWSGSGSTNQQWTREDSGGYTKFRNRANGLYLDGGGSTSDGANLVQYANSGSTNQQWIVTDVSTPGSGTITVDGNNIRAGNVNGLTFKGFGALSANSTSELLMDYKAQSPTAYAQLLRVLFGGESPVFTNVKIEMGNDRNNSTGPDPSTMRWESETPNVKRAQGFQLAADAKKVNPNVKVSLLRWNSPGWVNSNDKVYTWFKKTILSAYRTYGFMVDYVNPGLNERGADLNWTKTYANRVRTDSADFANSTEQSRYNQLKVVISDEVGVGSFGGSMISDAGLRDVVAAAGYHYSPDDDSAGNFKRLAMDYDKEIWNSEAQATFGNSAFRPNNNMRSPSVVGTGFGGTNSALEMGNTIIKGFVNSRRTNFIYQPAIGSFYEGGQYSYKEVVSARDPWSGWLHYDAAIDVLRHFSWFAKTGWENSSNTAGIWRAVPESSYTGATGTNPVVGRNGTPSYLTLAAPDRRNFSTVFMNDSEYTQSYRLQPVNMAYSGAPALQLWETRAADPGQAFNANYLKHLGSVPAVDGGVYSVTVRPNSVVTVTTLANHTKPEYLEPLPVEGQRTVLDTEISGDVQSTSDNILYADGFDYSGKTVPVIGSGGTITGTEDFITSRGGARSVIPRYASDRNGAFEAYQPDGSTNYVLRQQLDGPSQGLGAAWNGGDAVTRIGDSRWLNYKASVDVSFENSSTQNGANHARLGIREQHGDNGAPYSVRFTFDGGWQLLVNNSAVASGNVVSGAGGVRIGGFNTAHNAWHNIALRGVGSTVTAYLDGVTLATYTDPNPKLSGRITLGSGYYFTRFDNLRVETVDGSPPYYSEVLDNLEMSDLANPPARKLVYGGSWAHENGKGMYNVQRSLSTSQGSGSTLTYTFAGTGLDIIGPNSGSAVLQVTVDGTVVNSAASTLASPEFYQTYALRNLDAGTHTVEIMVRSGSLVVDAVGAVRP